MTFIYTPPEPAMKTHGPFSTEEKHWFTETQLRSEVERVRRETVEACAKCSEDTVTALAGLEGVERLIALGDDIADNIRRTVK